MRKHEPMPIRKFTFLVCVMMLSVPVVATSWTRTADFESGTLNTKAEAPDGFDGAAGRSTYTSKVVHSGTQAVKVRVRKGKNGFGNYGGIINFPEELKKGDDVWVKISTYFPGSYLFLKPPRDNKFFRVRTKGPQHGTRWNDIYMTDDRIRYLSPVHEWHTMRKSGPTRNEWHTYELYLHLDNVSKDDGGSAVMRFWVDGDVLAEYTNTPTLNEPSAIAYALYVFTWYTDSGPPKDLSLYVDDIVISTQPID